MFREMRRKRQQLSEEKTMEILKRNTAGTLALLGDEGYPYSVPISYVYDENRIIFHGAKAGHKIDAIKKENKASFSVIDQDQIVPEKYTTYFRSAVVFGKMRILEDEEEIRETAAILGEKYRPGCAEETKKEIQRGFASLCMMVLEIEHMSGKEAIELVSHKN